MYVIIDNYDSFTYNLYQYLAEITSKPIRVLRNDQTTVEKIVQLNPESIIISPGPGTPQEAGITVPLIKALAGRVPILGVCLGHQAIAYAFGATIGQARRIVHGKAEEICLDGKGLFRNLPPKAIFTRYHSLSIVAETLPADFEITARACDGEIMGIRHKSFILEGVQFHPESIASEYGKNLLRNFLNYRRLPFPVKPTLQKIMAGKDLSFDEAAGFMEEITDGNLNMAEMAGFLVALNMKGYTAAEIAGCASVLKRKKVRLQTSLPIIDTCGTGGDGKHTFNISSLAALILAALGVPVAKHGNRAVSSACGSADFYRALGITIDLSPEKAALLLDRTNFCFLFAPQYHAAMKNIQPVRRDLGFKTIMNLLGPLANPAEAQSQLIGVYDPELCEKEAEAARLLGVKRVMTVHGLDGLDEISVSAPTKIVELSEVGEKKIYQFEPQELGLPLYPLDALKGGDAEANAALACEIMRGGGSPAVRDAVLVNAGAAYYLAGRVSSIAEGFAAAKEALQSLQVLKKYEEIRDVSQTLFSKEALSA